MRYALREVLTATSVTWRIFSAGVCISLTLFSPSSVFVSCVLLQSLAIVLFTGYTIHASCDIAVVTGPYMHQFVVTVVTLVPATVIANTFFPCTVTPFCFEYFLTLCCVFVTTYG